MSLERSVCDAAPACGDIGRHPCFVECPMVTNAAGEEVHMKTMISLGTERRNEIVKDLYNPRLTAGIHEQAIMARSPRGTRPHSSLQ